MRKLILVWGIIGFGTIGLAAQSAATEKAVPADVQPSVTDSSAQGVTATAPSSASPSAQDVALEKDLQQAQAGAEPKEEGFVASRESVAEKPVINKPAKVVFNPKSQRDPTMSPDDLAFLKQQEQQRLAAIEAERQRRLAEEKRRRDEEERRRQQELARLKDPTREIRNKIHLGGIIGQEVFIGDKIYTVGDTVLGARIVSIGAEEVVFSYKGHKFVRKVKL